MITDLIASSFSLDPAYVLKVAKSASHRYKLYPIPKKSGGERIICQPARELKVLQYWLIENLFSKLPIHDAATAYKPGSNIRDNAARHIQQRFLLRVDFRDFFPSITADDVIRLLQRHSTRLQNLLAGRQDFATVAKLACRDGRLTIGAPSSPVLCNLVMYDFDSWWAEVSQQREVAYSRYADDLYFSTNQPNILSGILQDLREYLHHTNSPKLQINEEKTVFTSRKRLRLVTGLVLTPDRKISLGRKRKRHIKSMVFRFTIGALSDREITSLRGLIAYAHFVEPTFLLSLQHKFGDKLQPLLRPVRAVAKAAAK